MQGLLSQHCAIVPLLPDASVMTTAIDSDCIDMHGWDHCCMILSTCASTTTDSNFTVMAAAADGDKTQAVTFNYRIGTAACKSAGADVYSAPVAVATLAYGDTEDGMVLIIEFDTANMQSTAGVQYRYVTLVCDGAATTLTMSGVAILTRGRYMQDVIATAIPV